MKTPPKTGLTKKVASKIAKSNEATASDSKFQVQDIKPRTTVASLNRSAGCPNSLHTLDLVSAVTGLSGAFIHRVLGKKKKFTEADVICLLDQDAFSETFVPRSRILQYLSKRLVEAAIPKRHQDFRQQTRLVNGNAVDLIRELPAQSINCVVTSTPYWAMRMYKNMVPVEWADGEVCPFGLEQTPDGFIRHSTEILFYLKDVLKNDGSIWWNLMDTYNTRTQIRGNAAEALRAMQGRETRGWHDYDCRRYSAGHAYLADGEQCLIPHRIAQRASRLGYLVKSTISWGKTSSLPEPQKTRVSRNVEYVLHLAKQRAPYFDKSAFKALPVNLGGRNAPQESDKLSDLWLLPTASGVDGHGAQFPLALPGRCIGISTKKGDVVLDPFAGAGTSGAAAVLLGRRFIGFDTSQEYLSTATARIAAAAKRFSMDEKLERDALAASVIEL